MSVNNLFDNPIHHTHLVYSDLDVTDTIPKRENIHTTIVNMFTIENARRLSDIGIQKTKKEKMYILFIIRKGITHQAQNALLKICEEPEKNKFFYFFIPHGIHILETLKSRCVLHSFYTEIDLKEAEEYIKMNPAERIKRTDILWEKKQHLKEFLNALEKYISQIETSKKGEYIKTLYKIKNICNMPGTTRHSLHTLAFSWYHGSTCIRTKKSKKI